MRYPSGQDDSLGQAAPILPGRLGRVMPRVHEARPVSASQAQVPLELHVWFGEHLLHAAPSRPHLSRVLPGAHSVLEEQHPEQELALHTHWPDSHTRPAPHGGLKPHLHTPATHRFAMRGSHAGPLPQVQAPSEEQASAVSRSHIVQRTPPVPQVLKVEVVQMPDMQQPSGQLGQKLLGAGSSRTVTSTSRPSRTCTWLVPIATRSPWLSPSTCSSAWALSGAEDSSTRNVSPLASSRPGCSGRRWGPMLLPPTVPETRS